MGYWQQVRFCKGVNKECVINGRTRLVSDVYRLFCFVSCLVLSVGRPYLLSVSQFTDGFVLFSVMDYLVSAAAGKSPDDALRDFGSFVARAVVEFPAGLRCTGHLRLLLLGHRPLDKSSRFRDARTPTEDPALLGLVFLTHSIGEAALRQGVTCAV